MPSGTIGVRYPCSRFARRVAAKGREEPAR
jgi:hypothetical protein